MATKSILKIVRIRDKQSAVRLMNAMDKAAEHSEQTSATNGKFSEASRQDIRKMFGKT